MRGIFFEAQHADAVAALLRRDGFAASVEIERFAGEDDDEDHQWSVRTDAPALVLELLVDEFEGWLDDETDLDAPTVAPLPPLTLPTQPRRPGADQ